MKLLLNRWGYTPKGTFGTLILPGGESYYTVERPWRDNKPYVSCVPEGDYKLVWLPTTTQVPQSWGAHSWYLEGGTVAIHGGKERSRCCFHVGNTMDDINGCVAPGLELGRSWMVGRSMDALEEMIQFLSKEDHELVIFRGTA